MDQLTATLARNTAALMAATLWLCACSKPAAGARMPSDALDAAIGNSIGDPTTCVLLADPASGKVLYRYGQSFSCERPLPACDRPGTLTARTALALAATPDGRGASCSSNPEGTRTVGWAEGKLSGARRELVYSAVMEGERALPGREMAGRLNDVFTSAGL